MYLVMRQNRLRPVFYGVYRTMDRALERIEFYRSGVYQGLTPMVSPALEWEHKTTEFPEDHPGGVSEIQEILGCTQYMTAWDGTCTSNWSIIAVHHTANYDFGEREDIGITSPVDNGTVTMVADYGD